MEKGSTVSGILSARDLRPVPVRPRRFCPNLQHTGGRDSREKYRTRSVDSWDRTPWDNGSPRPRSWAAYQGRTGNPRGLRDNLPRRDGLSWRSSRSEVPQPQRGLLCREMGDSAPLRNRKMLDKWGSLAKTQELCTGEG